MTSVMHWSIRHRYPRPRGVAHLDSGVRRIGRPDLHRRPRPANAAAMPLLAIGMPPAAITGTFTASTTCGTSDIVPAGWRCFRQEHAMMAAGVGAPVR